MVRMICKSCSDEEGVAVFYEPALIGAKVRYGQYLGYFHADVWRCPRCGREIITGFSDAEIFDGVPDYDYGER